MPLDCRTDQTNTFNMVTAIFTVACNKFTCIITVVLRNNWSNDLTEDLCYIREGFYSYGSQRKAYIFVLSILHK